MNSICVASSGEVMFSGDSVGEVMVWSREEPGERVCSVCVHVCWSV